MHAYTRFLVVALLGACVADGGPPIEAEVQATALKHPDSPEAVGTEAQRFVREFDAHLERRGVTPDELLIAAMAGDEERVREMLGFTDAEYEAWYARLAEIATTAQAIDEAGASYPEWWTCGSGLYPCISGLGLGLLARGAASVPVILAIGGIYAASCVYHHCSFDHTDPGPPVRKP